MIVYTLPLDSMLARDEAKTQENLKNISSGVFTHFDHLVILTQDIFNCTDTLTEIEHVPCAFSQSKRLRHILSRITYLRWFYFFFSSFFWMLKHRRRIDLLISANIDSPVPTILRVLFGLPHVIWYHYDVPFQLRKINKQPIIAMLVLALERLAFKRASAVWITSPSLMTKAKMLGATRIQIIPNWIDINQIPSSKKRLARARRFCILFVGRLHPVKQVDLLIRAFHTLHKKNPNTRMIILGDGKERSKLVALTNELGLSDDIHFQGRVNRKTVFKVMNQADVLVLPSKVEGNPRVLIEAMINKVPIVATNVPGIRDIVQHMKTGFLIDNDKPDELMLAIEYVLRNKEDTSNMVKRAYTFAQKTFSKETVSQKIFGELVLLVPKYKAKNSPYRMHFGDKQ